MPDETYDAITARAAAAYDQAGGAYDQETKAFHATIAYPALLARLHARWKHLDYIRMLDVGCGSGRLLELLERERAITSGIDPASRQVNEAREKGLEVAQGDARSLPYPHWAFDAVVSYHALNYLPPEAHPQIFTEMRRVLRTDGLLLLAMLHPESTLAREFSIQGVSFQLFDQSEEAVQTLLREAGFSNIKTGTLMAAPELLAQVRAQSPVETHPVLEKFEREPYALLVEALL